MTWNRESRQTADVVMTQELGPQGAMPVTHFQGLDRKARYAKLFVPEGPLLVRAV